MNPHTKQLILRLAKRKKGVKSSQLAEGGGFSRVYAHRLLRQLVEEGKLVRVGKANQATYFSSTHKADLAPPVIRKILKNKGLDEDAVLAEIKQTSSIYKGLRLNIVRILDYAFTEILNNAIEHSRSATVDIKFAKTDLVAHFVIRDFGIGVFRNIQKKFRLKSELEAINHLLKGKQTTAPKAHSGEGLFFTSKVADIFVLESFGRKLLIDNRSQDIQILSIKSLRGTRVSFQIKLVAKTRLEKIFAQYAGAGFKFSKTKVIVRLSLIDKKLLSRSQARRIVFGLDKFKEIILDFKGVDSAGQAFCDEIFRVWQNKHLGIRIKPVNASPVVKLMISRAK